MTRKHLVVVGLLALSGGVLVVASVALANGKPTARAKGDSSPPPPSTTAAPVTTTTVQPVAALTGVPLADDTLRNRPAVVVKVDNAPEARPQFGIDKADVVYEEKVEGGLSRFMAIFQSQDADPVGPVRSLRSTDVFALRPLGGAAIGYSGGIAPFKAKLPEAHLQDLSADSRPGAYGRMAGRPYVHSMYTSTQRLRQVMTPGLGAPRPLFSYVDPGQSFSVAAGATPVKGVSGHVGSAAQFDWTWDAASATWKRGTDGRVHNLVNGQISARNVIIQFVPYRPTPYRDPANNPVDEAVLDGTGDSWVLSDGLLVPGRWVRPDLGQPTQYNDAAGQPVKLMPGNTWVILVAEGNAVAINP